MDIQVANILEVLKGSHKNDSFSLNAGIDAGMNWLSRAQDATLDGGVGIRFSLIRGWGPSYPETTGYIVPTFLRYFEITGDVTFKERAIKMAEWELSVQQADGSFIGGPLNKGVGKLVFDTGQIIFGLINAYKLSGAAKFLSAARKAGDWLVRVQDDDGAWRKFSFHLIPHTYHSRVAWPLVELSRVAGEQRYRDAAKRHLDWVLTNQTSNGWFEHAGFTEENNTAPYTHTIAYTLRGLLETGLLIDEQIYIEAVRKSTDELLNRMDVSGCFCGAYDRNWRGSKSYSCLTGNAQLSIIFSKLYLISRERRYAQAAQLVNDFLKTKQNLGTKNTNIRGAISGSTPVWQTYERLSYPNWATKFFIDALWTADESLNEDNVDVDFRKLLSFKYPG